MLTGETVLRHRIGALELLDGEPSLYHFGDGRVVLQKDSLPRLQYKLSDHLGNTVVLFEDRNGNGVVEEISGQPEGVTHYSKSSKESPSCWAISALLMPS